MALSRHDNRERTAVCAVISRPDRGYDAFKEGIRHIPLRPEDVFHPCPKPGTTLVARLLLRCRNCPSAPAPMGQLTEPLSILPDLSASIPAVAPCRRHGPAPRRPGQGFGAAQQDQSGRVLWGWPLQRRQQGGRPGSSRASGAGRLSGLFAWLPTAGWSLDTNAMRPISWPFSNLLPSACSTRSIYEMTSSTTVAVLALTCILSSFQFEKAFDTDKFVGIRRVLVPSE